MPAGQAMAQPLTKEEIELALLVGLVHLRDGRLMPKRMFTWAAVEAAPET